MSEGCVTGIGVNSAKYASPTNLTNPLRDVIALVPLRLRRTA